MKEITLRWSKVLSTVIFILIMLLFLTLAWREYTNQKSLAKLSHLSNFQQAAAQIGNILNRNKLDLQLFQHYIINKPDITEAEFVDFAKVLINGEAQISHIALAPKLKIKYIYPLEKNKAALNLNYQKNEDQYPDIAKAMSENKIILSGPVNLIQGGKALIFRVPVILADGRPWGLISLVINIEGLMKQAGVLKFADNNQISLINLTMDNAKSNQVLWANVSKASVKSQKFIINLSPNRLMLKVSPVESLLMNSSKVMSISLFGFMISLLISLIFYYILKTRNDLEQLSDKNQKLAFCDALTGLNSRVAFQMQVERDVSLCQRTNQKFALVYIDIDDFKRINDVLGHQVGDQLLIEIAHRLKVNLREMDFFSRLGGDEFAALIREFEGLDQIISKVTKRLLEQFERPFTVNHNTISLSASIGIAVYPFAGRTADVLLKNADIAMYQAKALGKNQFVIFTEHLDKEIKRIQTIELFLNKAIENKELYLAYQPIVDFKTGTLYGAETLIRWQNPTINSPGPDEFIPIAELSNLIHKLGDWIIKNAIKEYRTFIQKHDLINFKLSINISAKQFQSETFISELVSILNETGLPPHNLILEITETCLMANVEQTAEKLQQLHQMGVAIALDDFGKGYSSLVYLKNLPIDYIKIDKEFVSEISTVKGESIVELMILLAKNLKMKVIAEGIEQAEQYQAIKDNDCDFGQGYLMAKPCSFDEISDKFFSVNDDKDIS